MGDWTADLRAHLAALRLDPAREAEIVEELSQHLDDRYAELRAGGASDAEARRLAIGELIEAGGLAPQLHALSRAHKPAPIVHGQPGARLLAGAWQDLRDALRAARRQPGFTATIVLTLSLGIAVNSAVFTVVNAAVLRPLPFADVDRIVRLGVWNVGNAESPEADLSYLDFLDWQAAGRTFEQIGAVVDLGVGISGDDRPAAPASAAYVSWNMFALLGQPPDLGRDFTAEDDREGASRSVILSGNLWRARYGADPAIVGRTIRVDGIASTVIGVMPENFGFPDREELWLPLVALPDAVRMSRSVRLLDGIGKLRPGATIDQATTELSGITASLAERYPDTNRNIAPRMTSAGIASQFVAVMIVLLGAVGFVLLIACANVANLLLARAVDRTRDLTVRVALGASRWRIVRQQLVESVLLASAGGVVGFALSYPGVMAMRALPTESAPPYWVQFTIDRAVISYLVALCMGSALVCALVPARQATRTTLITTMNDGGRASAGTRSRRRWTGAFVIAQVAGALLLLTGAALMMQNLAGLVRTDAGVETTTLVRIPFTLQRFRNDPGRRLLFLEQIEERLASGPVARAALATNIPLGGAAARRLRIDGRSIDDAGGLPLVSLVRVGQGYFDVVGAPLLAGRVDSVDERRRPDESVVVNDRFARMYFQDGAALGKRILLEPPSVPTGSAPEPRWMTIVGVVGNVRHRLLPSREFDPIVYGSFAADPPTAMFVLTRSSDPAAASAFIGDQVRAVDPDVPLLPALTVNEAFARGFSLQQVFGSMFAIFASIALLMAVSGLCAVTSYAVSRRTREIGVRVALGADAWRVWWAVMGTTLRQLAVGLVLGAAGAAAVARLLPAFLVGTGGANPAAIAGVALVLFGVGLAASAVPARRAIRLDPVTALQAE